MSQADDVRTAAEPGSSQLEAALRRLEETDPADADEVLAAGEAAHELLQNRLRDSDIA